MEKSIAYSSYLWQLDAATELGKAWTTFRPIAATVQSKDVIQDLSAAHRLGSSLNRTVNFRLGPTVCKPLYKTRRPLIAAVRRLDWMSPTKYLGLKSRFTSQRNQLFSGTKTNVDLGNSWYLLQTSHKTHKYIVCSKMQVSSVLKKAVYIVTTAL